MSLTTDFPPIMEREDVMVHPTLIGGRLRLSTFISNYYDLDEGETHLQSVIDRWNDEHEVGISFNFWPSGILDSMIDLHERYPARTSICEEDKPMFDALRAELVQMIERIDALKFE